MQLEELYEGAKNVPSDINEHMETLKNYASECETVTEFGVRAISTTYAFLKGAKKVISYDLESPEYYGGNTQVAMDAAKEAGVDWTFITNDVLKVEIEPTDLLFIDTFHAYDQLTQELALHAPKVNKYIIMHDTVSFGDHDEPLTSLNTINRMTQGCGLVPAIDQFLVENEGVWGRKEVFTNNNGLTVLMRIEAEEETVDVVVTEDILVDNPDLIGQVEVGETIQVPVNDDTTGISEEEMLAILATEKSTQTETKAKEEVKKETKTKEKKDVKGSKSKAVPTSGSAK